MTSALVVHPLRIGSKRESRAIPRGAANAQETSPLFSGTAMTKSVTITENGKREKISKLEAAEIQLANDAARGDKKAIQLAFALLQFFEPTIEAQRPTETYLITGVLAEGARTV